MIKKNYFCVKRFRELLLFQYMKQNETSIVPESSSKFECIFCVYKTIRKGQYSRHLSTAKHLKLSNETNETQIVQKSSEHFGCLCGLIFRSRTTLWRHKKKCDFKKENITISVVEPEKVKITDDKLITMLIEQCKELRDENKELIEIIKNGKHTPNITNTNSNNKTFNLQLFLNETCKDAMNITDFVDSIQLQLSDLENVGKFGYVEGISNIITKNLKALNVSQRPVHCADKKREVLYVKDENKWEKDDDDKKKIRKAIKRVASKNQRLIPKFKEAHPDCGEYYSPFSDQYDNIILESMGGSGDNDLEKEDKIIKKITNATIIDKECGI